MDRGGTRAGERRGSERLVEAARRLRTAADELAFDDPVAYVYDPLDYARRPHEAYLTHYGDRGAEVLLVGMNPGPWGMAQTGVPFGEVSAVRDWMGIREPVDRPSREHPKRPIEGLDCGRSEASGQRLWRWARASFGTPERFFRRFFVANYCPLLFLEAGGRNRTPDKLRKAERTPLFEACDRHLAEVVEALAPRWVVGVGAFAEERARRALPHFDGPVGRVLHPSPASPRANRGWAAQAEADLRALGIPLDPDADRG